MFLVPGFAPLLAHTQLARKNDAATGSFCTRLFSPVSSFSIYLPCLYLPCLYISLVFISPPNPGPLTLLYSQFPSTHSRPRHLTRHAASANQGSRGISPSKWIHRYPVHLRSSQDVCGLYEEVRCKSYDLATVPGAFGNAATPAPNISPFFLFWQRECL